MLYCSLTSFTSSSITSLSLSLSLSLISILLKLVLSQQVLSRGRILQAEKEVGEWENFNTLSIPIKREMIPSARIVIFFEAHGVVAGDSIWIDVENKCHSTKEVPVSAGIFMAYSIIKQCVPNFASGVNLSS